MLGFVDGKDVTGARGHVSRGGHIGAQDAAARLVFQTGNTLGVGTYGRLQALAHSFEGARLLGLRPAPAIPGPFFHRDRQPMIGRVGSAELCRHGVRIGAAERPGLLSGPGRPLEGTRGGLDSWTSRCCRRLSWGLAWTTTARYGLP
jgi:hypothetical protein